MPNDAYITPPAIFAPFIIFNSPRLFAAGKLPAKRALLHSTSRRARETAAKLPLHIQDLEVWYLARET